MPMIADEYLDVATDILDITADVRIGAHLAPIDLDATIGLHVGAMEDDYDYRALGDDVTAQVLRWWPAAKAHQRAILGVAGLLQSEKALLELLWNVTGPLAGAYLTRKGRAPDNIFASVESDYHHIINALDLPNIQALRDPHVVHAVLDHDESLQRYCRLLHDQYQRAVEGLGELHPETFATAQQLVRQRVEQAQAIVAAEQAREAGRKRRRVRQVRKALRRGIRAMEEIVGPGSYKGFISKDGFVITGCLFDYHVSKPTSLLEHTAAPGHVHIPYHLEMRNKAGETLGRACIIFPDAPVLDQVVALALHVRDRETECRIVTRLNWLSITDAGKNDAYLHQLRPARDAPASPMQDLRFVPNRHMSYRRRIMQCIERDAVRAISSYIGMPLPIFEFMRDPENAPTENIPLLENCFQMMHALVLW